MELIRSIIECCHSAAHMSHRLSHEAGPGFVPNVAYRSRYPLSVSMGHDEGDRKGLEGGSRLKATRCLGCRRSSSWSECLSGAQLRRSYYSLRGSGEIFRSRRRCSHFEFNLTVHQIVRRRLGGLPSARRGFAHPFLPLLLPTLRFPHGNSYKNEAANNPQLPGRRLPLALPSLPHAPLIFPSFFSLQEKKIHALMGAPHLLPHSHSSACSKFERKELCSVARTEQSRGQMMSICARENP